MKVDQAGEQVSAAAIEDRMSPAGIIMVVRGVKDGFDPSVVNDHGSVFLDARSPGGHVRQVHVAQY